MQLRISTILSILLVTSLGYPTTTYSRPLKILFAVEVFPCSIQIFILNQITGLIDLGHHVSIFAFRDKEYGTSTPKFPSAIMEYDLVNKTYYHKLPEHKKFDIIYCQFGSTANKILPLLSKDQRPKFISCFRGGDASTAFIKNPHIYDTLFKEVDYVFPVCKHFAKRLIKHGCPKEKIIVHHSAIDCDEFQFVERSWPQNDLIKIVTVGRLNKVKGHEFAIRAMANVIKTYPNVSYTVIGDGSYKKEMQALITKLDMNDKIHLAGLISHDKIAQALQKAHLFLLVPYKLHKSEAGDKNRNIGMEEGIPNSLMEAMATGLPVIGTSHAGIPELITHTVSGLLVQERDIRGLEESLLYLIEHPERWPEFGCAGRSHVIENHNITTQLARLDAVFQKLTEKKFKKSHYVTGKEFLSSADFML